MSVAYAEVLLDAHVHYHDGFSRRVFFDAAWRNLVAGERQLRLEAATAKGLMFTESRGTDMFGQLAASIDAPAADSNADDALSRGATGSDATPADANDTVSGAWRFRATGEETSLWAERGADGARLLLIAGRQLVTREGLEVLALGCRHSFADGMELRAARDAVIDEGGIPVVPWGFGKWWFSRGRLLAELLAASSPGRWFLGDNSGRPRLSRRPRLFARAAEHGVFVLPGSDPLPLAGQDDKPGRCGFHLSGGFDDLRPASSVLDALRARQSQPATFGRHEGLVEFTRDQIAMQFRKRRGGDAARSSS